MALRRADDDAVGAAPGSYPMFRSPSATSDLLGNFS